MNDVHAVTEIEQSQKAVPSRKTATATITVLDSETHPYDQTVKPELLELR